MVKFMLLKAKFQGHEIIEIEKNSLELKFFHKINLTIDKINF